MTPPILEPHQINDRPHGRNIHDRRVLTLLLSAALLGLAVTVASARHPPPVPGVPMGALSTVAYLSDHLAAQPAPWVGHVLRVRAVIVVLPLWVMHGTIPARRLVARLVDPGGGGSLPLVLGPQDGLLAALRRLPVVGALAPPPQAPVWGRPVMYWVQVEAVRGPEGATYEAVLLDAGQQDT